jgi:thiamine biosynthesis lipoprotein
MPQIAKALFLIALLAGCEEAPPQLFPFEGTAMTIPYRILVDGTIPPEAVQQTIESTFSEVDLHYNRYNPQSELSRFNRAPANTAFSLSPGLYELLLKTDRIVAATNGSFDPSVETIQQIWKQSLLQGKTVPRDQIQPLMRQMGWHHLKLNGAIASKDQEGFALDLGGIAKGYAVDLLYERIHALGAKHLYVEWGGEIRVSKVHPESRPWNVAIRPLNPHAEPIVLTLSDQSVATSGDYEQSYTAVDDQGETIRYFHILDPRTGEPLRAEANQHFSCTVVAPDCTTADGLATALFFKPDLEKIHSEFPSVTIYIEETSPEGK